MVWLNGKWTAFVQHLPFILQAIFTHSHTHSYTNDTAFMSNLGFTILPIETLTYGLEESGIEPPIFRLVDVPLCFLSHSCLGLTDPFVTHTVLSTPKQVTISTVLHPGEASLNGNSSQTLCLFYNLVFLETFAFWHRCKGTLCPGPVCFYIIPSFRRINRILWPCVNQLYFYQSFAIFW